LFMSLSLSAMIASTFPSPKALVNP